MYSYASRFNGRGTFSCTSCDLNYVIFELFLFALIYMNYFRMEFGIVFGIIYKELVELLSDLNRDS